MNDDVLADVACRLVLDALAHGPLTWAQLAEAGLSRAVVFAGVDAATAAGLACFRVGPAVVERLDMAEEVLP